jgi:hypothetical protein
MDNLTNKIDEIDKLEKKYKELEGENNKLARKIDAGEGEICKIIKDAIDKIVKDNTIILDNFKEQSLKKISEIITDKKAYNIADEELKAIEQDISIKKKEYILLYIKSKGIKEDKVIYYHTDNNSQQSTDVSYIVYIENNKNIIHTQYTIPRGDDVLKNPIEILQKNTESDIHKYELDRTYNSIKAGNIKKIEKQIENIKINII